ncbi:MAG: hypothetical protein ABSF95_17040 [Verrucomicrobiota bacterium]|jgi:hypothetical protein
MSTNTGSEAAVPGAEKSRVGTIIRWGARITSIPIFALVVTALVPALASFAISAKEDRIIALGLCGACAGLLAGWRWAGIGGGMIVAGAALMLTQGENLAYPDPFSVAFGLQGILFLVSGMLNSRSGPTAAPALGWLRKGALGLLGLCALIGAATIYRGPGPTPVPRDKEAFIGVWEDGAGFRMAITTDGHAKISQAKDSKVERWNSPIVPGGSGVFLVYFRGDERLELTTGLFGGSKVYHIDSNPHAQGKQIKMVLNGSDPYKTSSGMVLVKKPPP